MSHPQTTKPEVKDPKLHLLPPSGVKVRLSLAGLYKWGPLQIMRCSGSEGSLSVHDGGASSRRDLEGNRFRKG